MKNSKTIVDLAITVREFLQNEARTLEMSKGKMLKDSDSSLVVRQMLKAG